MSRTRPNLFRDLLLATSALVASSALVVSVAHAGGDVSGGKVVVGKAVITTSGGLTTIEQASKKALINWQSFSIPSGSTVNFQQPGAKAITVNRVTGSDPSNIFGNLLANGRIWLINSNGILFGRGSQINVGALIATTSDISDSDFQNGHYRFGASKNPNASVVNQGTIHAADHGSVVLSAPHVSNDGVIQANVGTVVMGGANAFSVDLTGDNLIRYQVTQPVSQTQKNADGTAAALVANSGTIKANGGKVLMTARAAEQVEDNVINNTGIVEATSVSSHNGEIVLDGGDGGTVNAGGTLDASGKAAGQTGGSVSIAGSTVNVADNARIDASGDRGGGTVEIGGGVHGQGPLQHATTATVGNATIAADAISKGNGGTVAVWSDGNTKFSGHVSARGGAEGGNGGLVETSGKNLQVDPAASVNTMAVSSGKTGLWLLDPQNIDIITGGSDGLGGSNIDPKTITNALATTDVELEATNDITVESDVIYNSGNAFTMLAGQNIQANASIQNSGSGNINLIAGWDGTTTDLASLTNPGVFGNNSGSVLIGSGSSNVNIAIGSKSGTTTVAGANVFVAAEDGYAQIGYHGAGQGDIDVLATQGIDVVADGTGFGQIGNGGQDVIGNIGGDISAKLTNADGEIFVAYAGSEFGEAPAAAIIGNIGTGNSSQGGNILVDADGGALALGSVGVFGVAQIGNRNWGTSTGTASGDITVNAGVLEMVAGGGGFDQSDNRVQIGNGAKSFGTSLGGVSGDINIDTGSLLMESVGDDTGNNYSETRIGNLAAAPVSGDINITTTGDIDLSATGDSLTNIGSISDPVDSNGNPVQSSNTGNLTATSGGAISISGLNGGEARIESGGLTSGNVTVTADGDITLTAEGTSDVTPTTAEIGSLSYGNVNGTISVTSQHGNIVLDAGDTDTAQIGVLNFLTGGTLDVDINVAAGGDLTLTSSGSGSAIIGNGSTSGQTNTAGDITISVAGDTTIDDGQGGLAWVGNLTGDGFAESGNVTVVTGSLDGTSLEQMFGADLGSSDSTGGDVTVGITNTGGSVINGDVEYSSPHTLSILAAGNLEVVSTLENDGSGAINVVAGWDGHTLDSSQFTTSGVFGNNGGSLFVGGKGGGSDSSLSNGGGNAGIGTAGGTLTVAANNITLDTANGFAQLGYAGTGTGDINVQASGNITLTAGSTEGEYAQIGNGAYGVSGNTSGNITVNAGGDVALQSGATPFGAYAQIGNGTDESDANATGDIDLTATSLTLTADEGRAQVGNGGASSDGDFSGDITVNTTGDVTLAGGGVETWGFAMIGNGGDSSFGNDTGNIAITAGGNLSLTGGGDFAQIGNGGWGTDGTHQGDITINAADVTVDGGDVNEFSYAQIGNGGEFSDGDNSGNISITASGDVTLTGTGIYAQIGHGGGLSYGNNSGDITVTAAGNVSLAGGDAEEAYAQIGHGGAEANSADDSDSDGAGYSSTGAITVSADTVTLQGGSGSAAYAQIGQGGFLSGEGLVGNGVDSGDIVVSSQTTVSLMGGDGQDAYSQIGNGGDQVNQNAAAAATGNIAGTIAVTALAKNGISLTGGSGGNAYTQIGDGGLGTEVESTAPASNFTIGGDIFVTDLTLTGGNTGTNAYAQVGNGDAALNSIGNVSGDITVAADSGVTKTDGAPIGSVALLGNATGTGTVTGVVNGAGGEDQIGDQQGTVASLIQTINTVDFQNIAPPTNFPVADTFMTQGAELNTQPAGPLQELANSDETGEGTEPSDAVANNVGQSLSGNGHKQTRVAETIIPGVLKQIVLVNAAQPKGVPPADEDYSSWGNEAFWQW
jgi:filamentous hemagglutinin family protein